jgi:hypothetical protein
VGIYLAACLPADRKIRALARASRADTADFKARRYDSGIGAMLAYWISIDASVSTTRRGLSLMMLDIGKKKPAQRRAIVAGGALRVFTVNTQEFKRRVLYVNARGLKSLP